MGRDKATLLFCGQPMVGIAVKTLQSFCDEVAIAGERSDLACFAPVVRDVRPGEGPGAGLEAGLLAAQTSWSLFVPVDTPLLRADVLRTWAKAVLAREVEGIRLSYLSAGGFRQPAICLLHRDCLKPLSAAITRGTRRLEQLYRDVQEELCAGLTRDVLWVAEAEAYAAPSDRPGGDLGASFFNVNSPDDLDQAQQQARSTQAVSATAMKEEDLG